MEFKEFSKIPRLSRGMYVTEKIDGTNGLIAIGENGEFQVGSRNRWITTETGEIVNDNAGFARWALDHKDELMKLGTGFHYGEWWGLGIQRSYGMKEKHWSLFNVSRWTADINRPTCCDVVPTLYIGDFDTEAIKMCLDNLSKNGSAASPGFMKPEGVVIYHVAANQYFKKTIEKDEFHKGELA